MKNPTTKNTKSKSAKKAPKAKAKAGKSPTKAKAKKNAPSAGARTAKEEKAEQATLFADPAPKPAAQTMEIKRRFIAEFNLSLVLFNKRNARVDFTEDEEWAEFRKSVKEKGVQTPLWLRELPEPIDGCTHELIAGERRTRAAKAEGLLTVPVFDYGAISEQLADELGDLENAQRKDLNDAERALAYKAMLEKYGWDIFNEAEPHRSLAHRLNLGKKSVASQWIRLARMPKACLQALALGTDGGGISKSVAAQIARIGDPKKQLEALGRAITHKWTDEEAGKAIDRDYLRELKGVPFDRDDETLDAKAGSCTKCPFRTGNQLELAPELRRRGDVCTKPDCLRGKCEAHFLRIAEGHKAQGGEVLSAEQADKIGLCRHYTSLSHTVIDMNRVGHFYQFGTEFKKPLAVLMKDAIEDGRIQTKLAMANDGSAQIYTLAEASDVLRVGLEMGLLKKQSGGGSESNQAAETAKKRKRGVKLLGLQIAAIVGEAEMRAKKQEIAPFIVKALGVAALSILHSGGADLARYVSKRRALDIVNFQLTDKNNHRPLTQCALAAVTDPAELVGWLAELTSWPKFLGYDDPEKLQDGALATLEWLGLDSKALLGDAKVALGDEERGRIKKTQPTESVLEEARKLKLDWSENAGVLATRVVKKLGIKLGTAMGVVEIMKAEAGKGEE